MFNWKCLCFTWKHGLGFHVLSPFPLFVLYSIFPSIVLYSIWVLTCWLFIIVTDLFWRLCWVFRGPWENRFGFGCSFSQHIFRENAPKMKFLIKNILKQKVYSAIVLLLAVAVHSIRARQILIQCLKKVYFLYSSWL